MERLHELVGLNRYDLIVVDTPPTRNALDFLDAPSRMADFFSSRFLKWLIAPTRGGVVTLAAKPLTYIADRILGGAFLADITEFFLLLNSMYDGFVERAREVEALLANPGTSFLVVSTIESVPLQEATFFNEQLLQRGLNVAGWLVNRLLPAALRDPASPAALDTLRVTDLQAEADRLDVSVADVARIRDAVLAVAERGFQAATAEAARLAELAQGVTPVFAAATAEDEIDTFAGITTFGQRLLDAPRVVKFAE
jgi:anion-transporting  ArsA/GET3 family ATPase